MQGEVCALGRKNTHRRPKTSRAEMITPRRPPDKPPRVFFWDFNADSLDIVVYYWFAPPDWEEYLRFSHDFNMELLRRFNDEGIEFAFPTRTLYVKQDSPITADVRIHPGDPKQRR